MRTRRARTRAGAIATLGSRREADQPERGRVPARRRHADVGCAGEGARRRTRELSEAIRVPVAGRGLQQSQGAVLPLPHLQPARVRDAPFDHRGASSYYNHQTGGAKAILHADFDFSMRGHGNLYGALNDRGRSVTLTP